MSTDPKRVLQSVLSKCGKCAAASERATSRVPPYIPIGVGLE